MITVESSEDFRSVSATLQLERSRLICWISEVVFDLEAQELVDMVILEL
jgi:hypothetical protein